jgi:hypothetical protein
MDIPGTKEAQNLTNNHDGKVEALLDGFAVDLVGQVGKADISLKFLSKGTVDQRLYTAEGRELRAKVSALVLIHVVVIVPCTFFFMARVQISGMISLLLRPFVL